VGDQSGFCPACGCCRVRWVYCRDCDGKGRAGDGGGLPAPTSPCDLCDGAGRFSICEGRCDPQGRHWSIRWHLSRFRDRLLRKVMGE
jgi:hypothetical protein